MKSSDPVELEILVNPDGAPPPKRRRVESKPRVTEYLDLSAAASEQSGKDTELLAQLTDALRKKKKIVVIAGAGISVSAGIPDFRSSSGLFATLPKEHGLKGSGKHLFDASVYKHDSTTSHFHTMVRDLSQLVKDAKPTSFHHFLASLAKEGRLLRLYTQNVDGLETSMEPLSTVVPLHPKGPWPKTIQLHGGLEKMVCSKCNEISQFDASLFEGPQAPLCKGCEETDNVRTSHAGKRSHGIGRLRPRMVLYNEYNPDEEAIANVFRADLRTRPDAVIVVGTSMKIPGVRNMVKDICKVTRERRAGMTAWINLDSEPSGTDLKNCWDLVVRGKCDDVASLVHLPRFDESIEQGEETLVDNAKYENDVRGVKLEVEIRSSLPQDPATADKATPEISPIEAKQPPCLGRVQGIPTPSASPRIRTALPTKSASKPSQTKLTFSSSDADQAVSVPTSRPSKRTAQRKTKPTKKSVPKPKATINTTFKATKSNVAAPLKLPVKRELDTEPTSLDNVRSILLADFSLRPRGNKNTTETSEKGLRSQAQQPNPNSLRPCTPEHQMQSSQSQDTVSPPSKPRGMGTLID
ncbi:putative dhs-like NAD FAD-binding domain-containing protein [Rosellinia necatrix]|uniref:Putative dhs-like NAD FAD-binding domain-containing protein n=1 Tax=Rosellinia necatrix TaxID=77044 RepID=A0A1W2TB99_ROSNE|nr:putative dhs-like NAD FAD-binding domain-containing protein [Rosellinia necatrix]